MRTVGVKQLKAKLSEYLREVKRGEVFLVTDRDEVVAELRAAHAGPRPMEDDLDLAIASLADGGVVTAPRSTKGEWRWTPEGAGLPEGTATRLLDELRSDRYGGEG